MFSMKLSSLTLLSCYSSTFPISESTPSSEFFEALDSIDPALGAEGPYTPLVVAVLVLCPFEDPQLSFKAFVVDLLTKTESLALAAGNLS